MDAYIKKSQLSGSVNVPPSKSISHRLLIASALANGISTVSNLVFSNDIKATIESMSKLGSKFLIKGSEVTVSKCDVTGGIINAYESGSTIRFLIPIALTILDDVTFIGENNLVKRPLNVYLEQFDLKGIKYEKGEDELPLRVKGKLKSGDYLLRGDVSSQFITGLLFALPLLDGDSKIIITTKLESKGYIDLTLDVLKKFNISIINENYKVFHVKGNQQYIATDSYIEGDYSQAAFYLVAGAISGGVKLLNMNKESLQGDKKILEFLDKMNAKYIFNDEYLECFKSDTIGTIIDLSQAPDLGPIITVLASLSKGRTNIVNASRLRIKESDRIKAITTELNKMGAKIKELPDGMIVDGVDSLHGAIVDSWNDHRIAMALAIASLRCDGDVLIKNASCVNKSYPHFFSDFENLGGNVKYE